LAPFGAFTCLEATAAESFKSYTGTPIAENFDSLGTVGTDITLITGWNAGHFNPIINQGTTGGDGATTVTDALVVDNGSHDPNSTPMLANFGISGASDRALGSFARTSAGDQFLQLAIKNDSGSPITSFVLNYTGEQWRSPQGTSPQPLTVWYSNTDATNGFVSMGANFTFYSPNNSSNNVPLEGNDGTNRTVISATYMPAAPIAAGSTFYIRWYDINENGLADDYLAIDDLTVTPDSTPQPLTVGITSLANNAPLGTYFAINATVAGGAGTVTNVYFYYGSTLLGSDDTGPYSYAWNPVVLGNHALTAVAWDNTGLAATSAVVNVTVIQQQVQYVIVISVDGLGGTYLNKLFNGTATGGPYAIRNFTRLKNEGASTLAAHCDNDNWETLPNHTSIMTARPQLGANGHGWTSNSDPAVGQTIHSVKGSYVASVFDVAHDNGLRTGIYVNKTKFMLFDTNASYTGGGSYNATYGAPDTILPDNGRDKIDNTYINTTLGGIIVNTFIAQQNTASPNQYAFMHINEPDYYGHNGGWGSATWNSQVVVVDTMLGKIFKLIEQDVPAMIGKTAIILTADHGNQDNPPTLPNGQPDRYAVPVFVWGPGVAAGADLYALNAGTRQVASSYPMTTYGGVQPIRNAEVNNLALNLMGLGAIPGSMLGTATNKLAIAIVETPALLGIVNNGDSSITVTFAGTPGAQYRVQANADLAAPGSWVNVSTNVADLNGRWTYTRSSMTGGAQQFFRAARP
jgi:Type I phosphodiesterase / nucleotide pyrophosphatase/Bacterial Ig domain